jgi:hypothetical protein
MDSLMEMNNNGNHLSFLTSNYKLNKIICLFNWLDTKIQITDHQYDCIKKTDLQKYVITNYFDNCYYQNIDLVKQLLKIYFKFTTKEQEYKNEYQYVKYRNEDDYTSIISIIIKIKYL